jgi:ELWxxDGT repeat protein
LKAFFQATTPSVGTELYVTDGTPSGTALVKDILVGPGSALNVLLGGTPGPFGADKFVFTAIDRYSTDGIANQQIWITDGTLSGTHPLSSSSEGFHARALYVDTVANRIFFIAGNPSTGMELWTSDGSPSGAVIVRDICPGPCNGAASGSELGATLGISPLGDGRVMLRGNNGSSGTEPVVSDGTSQGTSLFEIVPGSVGSSPLYFWALPSGSVVIYASDGSHGHEPWIARP